MSNSGTHLYLAIKLAQYNAEERLRHAEEARTARRFRRARRAD
jgi:hypothetical protein